MRIFPGDCHAHQGFSVRLQRYWLPLSPPANKRDVEGILLGGRLPVLGVGVFGELGALGVDCRPLPHSGDRLGAESNQIEAALVDEDAIAAAAGGLSDDAQLLKVCKDSGYRGDGL